MDSPGKDVARLEKLLRRLHEELSGVEFYLGYFPRTLHNQLRVLRARVKEIEAHFTELENQEKEKQG
jgi:hypothetical protein